MSDSNEESPGGKKGERLIPDFVRKAFQNEMVAGLSSQVSKTKDDLFRALSKELREFLQSAELVSVLRKVLSSTSLEISTKVRFVDEGDSLRPKPEIKIKVNPVADDGAGKPEP